MSKKFLTLYFIIIFIAVFGQIFVLAAGSCRAEAGLLDNFKCAKCTPTEAGASNNCECTLDDFIVLAVKISTLILGLTGSLALVAFIYGGVLMLISGGSSEKVTQAKAVIFGAVIGIVIVFASYIIIGFIFNALGIQGATWNQINSGIGWFPKK